MRCFGLSSRYPLFSAIQLHPTKPALWIMAASWEFEENANIVAARGDYMFPFICFRFLPKSVSQLRLTFASALHSFDATRSSTKSWASAALA